MTIVDMSNLWTVTNTAEDFKIFVVAMDEEEAMERSREYFSDAGMDSDPSNIEIAEFVIADKADCDYIVY